MNGVGRIGLAFAGTAAVTGIMTERGRATNSDGMKVAGVGVGTGAFVLAGLNLVRNDAGTVYGVTQAAETAAAQVAVGVLAGAVAGVFAGHAIANALHE